MITNEHDYLNEKFNELQRFIQITIGELSSEAKRPSVIYKPKIFIDGNMWCVLLGEDIQSGVCAFGYSPESAMRSFDKEFLMDVDEKNRIKRSVIGSL